MDKSSRTNDLPNDILKLLLLYLKYDDIFRFFRISTKYHQLDDERFWCQYLLRKKLPTTCREMAMLDEFGWFKEYSSSIGTQKRVIKFQATIFDEIYDIKWDRSDESLNKDSLVCENEHNIGIIMLPRKYRKYIVFRQTVILDIPFYNKSVDDTKDRRKFVLYTNTPIGSTFGYFLMQIYHNMYNDEIKRKLKNLEDKIWTKVYVEYRESENIYILDIDDDDD